MIFSRNSILSGNLFWDKIQLTWKKTNYQTKNKLRAIFIEVCIKGFLLFYRYIYKQMILLSFCFISDLFGDLNNFLDPFLVPCCSFVTKLTVMISKVHQISYRFPKSLKSRFIESVNFTIFRDKSIEIILHAFDVIFKVFDEARKYFC